MHRVNDAHLADAIAAKQLTPLEHAFDAIVSQASGPLNAFVALALGLCVSTLGGSSPLITSSIVGFYALRIVLSSIQSQDEAKRAAKLVCHPQVQTILSKAAASAPASMASQNGTAWLLLDTKGAEDIRIFKKFEYARHRRGAIATGGMLDEVSVSSEKIVHRRYIGRDQFTLATHKVKWARVKARPLRRALGGSLEAAGAYPDVHFSSMEPDYRATRFLLGQGTGFKD